jgi:DNA-binding IclR family transcriptional regulator
MAQSLVRGLNILFLFSADRPALTVKDIARGIGVPLPTAYRLVKALAEKGLLERDRPTAEYRLGLTFLDFAAIVHRHLDLASLARPLVKKLASASGETAQFTLRRAEHGVCVVVEESLSTLRVAPEPGRTLPLHAGASVQAILAFLPEQEQARILAQTRERFTPRTLTDRAALQRRLRTIRRQGYAVSRAEAYPGALGIAAPVLDSAGRVVGSLAISGPAARMEAKRQALTESVVTFARELSTALGWHRESLPAHGLSGRRDDPQ